MILWIADDDVYFSFDLKKKIEESSFYKKNKDPLKKIEVFHNLQDLRQAQESLRKRKDKTPDLLIWDHALQGESLLEYYRALQQDENSLVKKIIFCSAVSYGTFQKEWGALNPPLFFLKSQFSKDVEKIIEAVLSLDGSSQPALNPLKRRHLIRMEELFKKIRGLVYDGREMNPQDLSCELTLLREVAVALEKKKLTNMLDQFFEALKTARKPSPIKLRASIKEVLACTEKIIEDLK